MMRAWVAAGAALALVAGGAVTAQAVSPPQASVASSPAAEIAAGYDHSCTTGNGRTYCRGTNPSALPGDNTTSQTAAPVAVTTSAAPAGKTPTHNKSAAPNARDACANGGTGAAHCRGANPSGQPGDNTTGQTAAPTAADPVPGPPTRVTATPGDGTAAISWTAPSSFGTGHRVSYVATATASPGGTFSCWTTSTACTITGLANATAYRVTVITYTITHGRENLPHELELGDASVTSARPDDVVRRPETQAAMVPAAVRDTTEMHSLPSSPAATVTPVGVMSMTVVPSSATLPTAGPGSITSAQLGTVIVNDDRGLGTWTATVSGTAFTGPQTIPLTDVT